MVTNRSHSAVTVLTELPSRRSTKHGSIPGKDRNLALVHIEDEFWDKAAGAES
jgi:hypothetical protein